MRKKKMKAWSVGRTNFFFKKKKQYQNQRNMMINLKKGACVIKKYISYKLMNLRVVQFI